MVARSTCGNMSQQRDASADGIVMLRIRICELVRESRSISIDYVAERSDRVAGVVYRVCGKGLCLGCCADLRAGEGEYLRAACADVFKAVLLRLSLIAGGCRVWVQYHRQRLPTPRCNGRLVSAQIESAAFCCATGATRGAGLPVWRRALVEGCA